MSDSSAGIITSVVLIVYRLNVKKKSESLQRNTRGEGSVMSLRRLLNSAGLYRASVLLRHAVPRGRGVSKTHRLLNCHNSRWSGAYRHFGNAPTRVRPVEVPREFAFRQSERETSASLLIVFMFIVPMWMILLWHQQRSAEQIKALEETSVFCTKQESKGEDY